MTGQADSQPGPSEADLCPPGRPGRTEEVQEHPIDCGREVREVDRHVRKAAGQSGLSARVTAVGLALVGLEQIHVGTGRVPGAGRADIANPGTWRHAENLEVVVHGSEP